MHSNQIPSPKPTPVVLCSLLLLVLAGVWPGLGLARSTADTTQTASQEQKNSRWLPPRMAFGSVVYVPQASYSSEASLGLGGQVFYGFQWPVGNGGGPSSDLRLKGRVTLKGQGKIEIRLNSSFGNGDFGTNLKLSYDSMPRRFYGIGPDSRKSDEEIYRPQDFLAYIEIIRKIVPRLRFGIRYEVERQKLLEVEPGGILDLEDIRGKNQEYVLGLGVLLDLDTRNRRYSPTSGSYYQFFAMIFDEELGSKFDFNVYNLDLRNYFSFSAEHVLATQFFIYSARGNAPFWRNAALGGRGHTRGYRKGRYLDRLLVAGQAEYRFPVYRRLGGVVFAGLADVSPTIRDIELEHMRPSIGGGIRYRPGSRSGIKGRIDVGFGGEGTRVYLSLGEAF